MMTTATKRHALFVAFLVLIVGMTTNVSLVVGQCCVTSGLPRTGAEYGSDNATNVHLCFDGGLASFSSSLSGVE